LFIWRLVCALAGVVFLVYTAASLAVGGGEIVMPLDDTYIHFQYARVLAEGYPYQYNPSLPPTSGATSFLYPYVLAIGYVFGFKGLNLGLWAMGIGAVALALSAWIVFRFGMLFNTRVWLAAVVAIGFELNGAITWHFMSGMETGLAILFALYTVYALARESYWGTIAGATLVALVRPEAAILALLAVGATVWRERKRIPPHPPTPSPRLRGGGGAKPRVETASAQSPSHADVGAQHAAPLQENAQGAAVGATHESPLQHANAVIAATDTKTRRPLRPGWAWLCLLIPITAIGLQPLVNLLLTGSVVASGNVAKSLFGIVPFDSVVISGRIWDNFWQMWWGFFSPANSPVTVGAATMVIAAFGFDALYDRREPRALTIVIGAALLLGTLAISTLDTAFWHFKRYQMPYIALFFLLLIPGVTMTRWQSRSWQRFATALLILMMAVYVLTIGDFVRYYTLNVGYIASQPLPMARWLRENTPTDSVVAVHDTGSLRYIGERTTIDIVGLTTPGAAEAWRNGPGSVAEFLERERPDYVASYGSGHGYGLGYLEATDLYGEALATYTVELDPQYNVALAAPTQGIYRPRWDAADRAYDPIMLPFVTRYLAGMEIQDEIDVADVYSERVHDYQWHNEEPPDGFPTEVYQFPYVGCTFGENCFVMDGGRRINGDERFAINARPGADMVLVTRLHPANAGDYDVFANDILISGRVVPPIPGGWLDVATLIPGELVTEHTRIHIVPRTAGNFYMPYQHWAFQGNPYTPAELPGEPLATFQEGAIALYNYGTEFETHEDGTRYLIANWFWGTDGSARGDYKIFVHLLDEDGSITAQADVRPGMDTLPPGNWLPGMFRETISINITDLPPGTYEIALGLYHPVTNETLMPTGGDEFGRLIVDTIEIQESTTTR
jgi:hypothetical protein